MGQRGVLRVILLTEQAPGAQGIMHQILGVIFKSWRSSQHCGAVPRTRCCLWAEVLAAQRSHGSAEFHSGCFYTLQFCFTDISQLPLSMQK